MMPDRDWFHVTGHTYGTWLPGDPRGWATRHGRTESQMPRRYELDPDLSSAAAERTSRLMGRAPVRLSPVARQIALDSMVAAFTFHTIEVACCAVGETHFHALVHDPGGNPRHWVGIAKKESARRLSSAGLVEPGGVWAVRSHARRMTSPAQFSWTLRYIARHGDEGAVVWTSTTE